jgi:hypothetical protein
LYSSYFLIKMLRMILVFTCLWCLSTSYTFEYCSELCAPRMRKVWYTRCSWLYYYKLFHGEKNMCTVVESVIDGKFLSKINTFIILFQHITVKLLIFKTKSLNLPGNQEALEVSFNFTFRNESNSILLKAILMCFSSSFVCKLFHFIVFSLYFISSEFENLHMNVARMMCNTRKY